MNQLRIVSLLPSATEIARALGHQKSLVGVSHACELQGATKRLPVLTRSIVPPGISSAEVDRIVATARHEGRGLYELDVELLNSLRPDVIITQELCDVCAVDYQTVARLVRLMVPQPILISLSPGCIEDVLQDVLAVGSAIGEEERASGLVAEARDRLASLGQHLRGVEPPRVLALEWFSPPFFGGHWVPEQVQAAGGVSVLGASGRKSERTTWDIISECDPDIIVLMPCGYDLQGSLALTQELRSEPAWNRLRAVASGNVWAVDANGYFSRPSLKIVSGAEALAHIFHPTLVGAPADVHCLRQVGG